MVQRVYIKKIYFIEKTVLYSLNYYEKNLKIFTISKKVLNSVLYLLANNPFFFLLIFTPLLF